MRLVRLGALALLLTVAALAVAGSATAQYQPYESELSITRNSTGPLEAPPGGSVTENITVELTISGTPCRDETRNLSNVEVRLTPRLAGSYRGEYSGPDAPPGEGRVVKDVTVGTSSFTNPLECTTVAWETPMTVTLRSHANIGDTGDVEVFGEAKDTRCDCLMSNDRATMRATVKVAEPPTDSSDLEVDGTNGTEDPAPSNLSSTEADNASAASSGAADEGGLGDFLSDFGAELAATTVVGAVAFVARNLV